jgi:glutathione synthase/RimK-type ligase-like ATP-grasp enzyme
MKKIYLLTNSCGLIPQRAYERESLNIEIMEDIFKKNNFEVLIIKFDVFINGNYEISNNYFFYASSQFTAYKEYIQDILIYIESNNGIIIPNFNSFIAHENKMLQELEMKRLDIKSPNSNIVGTYEEGIAFLSEANFPIIAKKSKGFGSKTVEKINSLKEGKIFLKKNLTDGFTFNMEYFKWLYKKWKYDTLYPKQHGKVIFQEMIENLLFDWKVLIFNDVCFVLKRFTKKDDFRASGSGIFDYTPIPSAKVLDFALETKTKLKIPFASFDIVESDSQCFLIEYQSIHFGLLTALNAEVYYKYENNNWNRKKKDLEVDYFFANSIVDYIKTGND